MTPVAPPTTALTPSKAAPHDAGAFNRSLQGLRGFSALCVLVYHLHNMTVAAGFAHPHYAPITQTLIAGVGHFGVMLFFILSGYLILQSLLRHRDVPRFLRSRIARIYPVFLVPHLVMFTLGPLLRYDWMAHLTPLTYVGHFISNLFFLPSMFALPTAQKNAWSLGFEWVFYLFAVAFVYAIGTGATAANHRFRVVLRSLVAPASAVFLYFHPYAAFFVVGVALFFAEASYPRSLTVLSAAWLPWLGFVWLVGAFVLFAIADENGLSGIVFAAALGFATLLCATVIRETGWLAALLRTHPLTYIGCISYSLYLLHPFVLDPLRALLVRLVPRLGNTAAGIVFVLLGTTVSLVVADLSYRWIETAFTNRYLKQWVAGKTARLDV